MAENYTVQKLMDFSVKACTLPLSKEDKQAFSDTFVEAAVMVKQSTERIAELEKAIVNHRSQKADDRCIEDDDKLYEALGDGIKCDRQVGDKVAMLHNCQRFIENRCQGGKWPGYAELEAERDELRKQLADLRVDRDTLAGEVNELRAVDAVRTEINKGDPGAVGVVLLRGKLMTAFMKSATARKKTDASGALTRAGKDHT